MKTIVKMLVLVVSAIALGAVADDAESLGLAMGLKPQESKPFYTLPICRLIEGEAQVLVPNSGEGWVQAEEGKAYALGTRYRTGKNSKLVLDFGLKSTVTIGENSGLGTRMQPLIIKELTSRTIELVTGVVEVKLPPELKRGMFFVAAPGFIATDLNGETRYLYNPSKNGDGQEATIRCISNNAVVKGRHFLAKLSPADEIMIRTSNDVLFSGIFGQSGDVEMELDQGQVVKVDPVDNSTSKEEVKLPWRLTPKTAVRIHRAVPAIGERLAVSVMTFNAAGELCNRCAFTEGICEVTTGELVVKTDDVKAEEVKKAEAAAADVVEEEVAVPEEDAEPKPEASAEANSDGTDAEAANDDDDF